MRVLVPIVIAPSTLAPAPTTTFSARVGWRLPCSLPVPQSHPLVEQATVADFGRFADHHPHAVVDEHAAADAGAGVDFDAGEASADSLSSGRPALVVGVQSRWAIRCRLIAWKPDSSTRFPASRGQPDHARG